MYVFHACMCVLHVCVYLLHCVCLCVEERAVGEVTDLPGPSGRTMPPSAVHCAWAEEDYQVSQYSRLGLCSIYCKLVLGGILSLVGWSVCCEHCDCRDY